MDMNGGGEHGRTVGARTNEESDGNWSFTVHKPYPLKPCVYFLRSQTELFDHQLRLVTLDSLLEIALIRLGQEDAVVLDIYNSLLDIS